MKKFTIDPAKALSIAATCVGVVGTLLSSKVQANERKALKAELKEELLNDLMKEKN